MPDIKVKTIKGFNNGGAYVKRNQEITVDELRARDLLRNGLIEEYDVKKSAEPENKKAPEPANKGGKGTATKAKE
ncbi:hypothetical protein N5K35_13865 [Pseudomonas sp. GD03651]|uniref:hypothetical protein n=1 Tax=unclassified Pseudomonas TaxID=196821 RepID=UPI001C83F42D|nr:MULTISPECIES: hypothetical protein [unclassified Pseudomonas]MBX6689019.1 hypothetical protein [Pseudomonas sp. USTB-Z]MDH2184794.1 hypothetical protein [Pseudomonas sp. GD03651]HEN8733330.1 hypothetical protein [Pseudomonas putida]